MSEHTDKRLSDLSKIVPNIIFYVGLLAFLIACGVYGITGGTHSNSGTIGDTIGGTTAPFIGILSAVLIYFSFRAQIRANEITREQSLKAMEQAQEESNFKYLIEEFERVKKEIEKYSCSIQPLTNGNTKRDTGYIALEYFSTQLKNLKKDDSKTCLIKAKYVLLSIENMIKEQKLTLSKDFRNIINSKMTRYYNENLEVTLSTIANWKIEQGITKPTEVEMLLSEVKAGAARIISLFTNIEA